MESALIRAARRQQQVESDRLTNAILLGYGFGMACGVLLALFVAEVLK